MNIPMSRIGSPLNVQWTSLCYLGCRLYSRFFLNCKEKSVTLIITNIIITTVNNADCDNKGSIQNQDSLIGRVIVRRSYSSFILRKNQQLPSSKKLSEECFPRQYENIAAMTVPFVQFMGLIEAHDQVALDNFAAAASR